MKNPRLNFLVLAGLWLLSAGLTARAAGDPGDEYLRGYMMLKDAEKLEAANNPAGALSLYQQMAQIFDSVAQNHPDWQPEMLTARRNLVSKALARLQATLSQAAQPVPVAAAPSVAPATAAPAPALPALAPASPPGGLPSLSEALSQWEQAYRQRVQELETQNNQMQSDLGKWQQWFQWASGEITGARGRLQEIEGRSASLEKSIQAMQQEVAAGRAAASELEALKQEKLALKAEYQKASQRLGSAEKTSKEASQKLADASLRISELETERNKLLSERDSAAKERDKLKTQNAGMSAEIEVLKKRAPASQELTRLLKENERLRKELTTAQEQLGSLKSDATRKDEEIASLRGQITSLQGEITSLRQQSGAYQNQVADLTLKLKRIQEENPEAFPPELTRENDLLREIIMRQLRSQYRQQQAKDLVLQELRKMEGVSREILEQVDELNRSRLTLTPEEEKLFTDPAVREMLGQEGGIQGTLIARISKKEDPELSALDKLLNQANEAFAAQKFTEAAGLFEEALRAEPQNATALIGLGYARQRENKLDEAVAALKKCLAVEPDNDLAAFHLGVTEFKQQKWQDAMGHFEKSLAKNSRNARGRHYLGIISTKLNLPDRAEREFKTALAIDPAYGEAHFNLAVLYATWDPPRWDQARSEYQEAIKKGVQPDEALETLLKNTKSVSTR
jgi:tetratricopeptide (TPR) repeat protein